MSDFIGPTGMLSSGPAPGGWQLGSAATPINKPPAGMTYGSGVGASSGIGSNLTPTASSFGRFAGGLLSGLTGGGGGGSASSSAQPQPSRRMAGSDEFLKALQAFSSNNSGGFTNMGDGFSMYQPPRPGAEVKETTKSEGGAAGSRGAGSRIAGGASGALGGAATGAQLGSVVPGLGTAAGAGIGAIAGGLGGAFG